MVILRRGSSETGIWPGQAGKEQVDLADRFRDLGNTRIHVTMRYSEGHV